MHLQDLIFDLDGTLVDSVAGIEYSVDCALAECGFAARGRGLRSLIGPPIRRILCAVADESDRSALDALESAFRRSYDSEGWKKTMLQKGAKETLEWLVASGRRAFVFTNKPLLPTSHILDRMQSRHFFSDVVCRDSTTPPYEQKADMLRAILEGNGLSARGSMVVGDTNEDVTAAMAAGIRVALVPGYGPSHAEAAGNSCVHLQSLTDLKKLVFECEESA